MWKSSFIVLALLLIAGCDYAHTEKRVYSYDEVRYFDEIVFGSDSGQTTPVYKWNINITVLVVNSPSVIASRLDTIIEALDTAVGNSIKIRVQVGESNRGCGYGNRGVICVRYVSREDFQLLVPPTYSGGTGYHQLQANSRGSITSARVYIIRKNGAEACNLHHVTLEEITQSLGFTYDSDRYKNSIFYDEVSEVQDLSPLDRVVIEMLYRDEIDAGMSRSEVLNVLGGI